MGWVYENPRLARKCLDEVFGLEHCGTYAYSTQRPGFFILTGVRRSPQKPNDDWRQDIAIGYEKMFEHMFVYIEDHRRTNGWIVGRMDERRGANMALMQEEG